jgi:cold shock CspA family protein
MFGTVKFYNIVGSHAFGFIERDDMQGDVYVSQFTVERAGLADLRPGDRCEFEIAPDRNGRTRAVDLKVTSRSTAPPARPARSRDRRVWTGGGEH